MLLLFGEAYILTSLYTSLPNRVKNHNIHAMREQNTLNQDSHDCRNPKNKPRPWNSSRVFFMSCIFYE